MRVLFLLPFVCPAVWGQEPPAAPAPSPAVTSQEATKVNPLYGAVVSPYNYRPMTGKERWLLYWNTSYNNPGAAARTMLAAAMDQKADTPPVWGQGMAGYGRRMGNHFGRFTLQDSYEEAAAAALGHEVRYMLCKCTGFWPRTKHALAMNIVTLDKNGKWVPHYSRIGGTFASEYTANLWMPRGYQTNGEALRGIALQFTFSTLFNLVKEFSPELNRVRKRKGP